MYVLLFILTSFLCLVIVGVKYDKIVPPFLKMVKRKRLNVWCLVFSLFSVFFSLVSLLEKPKLELYSPGAQSLERWGFPVHNRIWFAVFFASGLVFIVSAFLEKPKKKQGQSSNDHTKICISCGTIGKAVRPDIDRCVECGGPVEDISGVFDRHPDLLNKTK